MQNCPKWSPAGSSSLPLRGAILWRSTGLSGYAPAFIPCHGFWPLLSSCLAGCGSPGECGRTVPLRGAVPWRSTELSEYALAFIPCRGFWSLPGCCLAAVAVRGEWGRTVPLRGAVPWRSTGLSGDALAFIPCHGFWSLPDSCLAGCGSSRGVRICPGQKSGRRKQKDPGQPELSGIFAFRAKQKAPDWVPQLGADNRT